MALHLSPEDKQGSAHYDEGGHQDLDEETAGDDAVTHVPRRLPDDIRVHWLHPQAERKENCA